MLGTIERAAKELVEGDFFLLTYSGHGGQINDVMNDDPDGLDETWVLFDRQLVDDEPYVAFSMFRHDVLILVFSDSCHRATMTKELFFQPAFYLPRHVSVPVQLQTSDPGSCHLRFRRRSTGSGRPSMARFARRLRGERLSTWNAVSF